MADPEENKIKENKENGGDPGKDVETVVSNNDNIEPVPDKEQLDEKKKAQE